MTRRKRPAAPKSVETRYYEGEATFDQVYEAMRSAGFAFKGFLDQLLHPATGQPLQGDAIFTRL